MLSRCLRVLIFTSFSFEYYLTSFFFSSRLSFSSVTVWGMAVVCMNICAYVYVYENRYMHVCKRKEEFLKITVTSSTQDSNPSKSDQNEKRVTPLPLPLARWGSRASPPSLRAANLISRESSHPPKSSHSCLRIPTAWNTFLGVSSRPGNYTQRAASERLGGGVNIE